MDFFGRGRKRRLIRALVLSLIGVLLNLLGAFITDITGCPLYLDSIGTVLVSAVSGPMPGITVGLVSNLLKIWTTNDFNSIYYGCLNVIIAFTTAFLARRGAFKKVVPTVILIFLLALIGGGIGSLITWFLFGFASEGITAVFASKIHETLQFSPFLSQLTADCIIDLADKAVSVVLVVLLFKAVPEKIIEKFQYAGWQQAPLLAEHKMAIKTGGGVRKFSLRTKLLLLLVPSMLIIAVVATAIGYTLFIRSTMDDHEKIGISVSRLAATVIDPEMVDDYLKYGEAAQGYKETEEKLYTIRDSSPDILYVYVYQIDMEGCHVVFDLDTDDMPGAEPGDVVPFDLSFATDLHYLLAGKEIAPKISNDTFGWLLTSYTPVYDSEGKCVCYACADISMNQLMTDSYTFLTKQISLFLGVFIFVLAVGIWLSEYNIIYPVNSMAYSANKFAFDSEAQRERSVENIHKLKIKTGDEIENLYKAFTKMTEDSMEYVKDIQTKSKMIYKMQTGLIYVLADMVESRDKITGDHIKKTSAYVDLIARKMKEKGIYADQLSDEYVSYLKDSAPLHDIGKIAVSDLILNKKGKLTDDEYEIMKTHTTSGRYVIDQVIKKVHQSGYLEEAKNMANYHHERWDGKGYPEGLKGEEIPLSARIMTVADVFDALLSRRSYKEPFSFEQAMNIIKEGAGTQFDPKIAELFIGISDDVRKIADDFSEE